MRLKNVILLSLSSLLIYCTSTGSNANRDCHEVAQHLESPDKFSVDVSRYGTPSEKNLLLIPPTGGENIIDRSYASKFCKAGYQVFILKNWTNQTEEKSIDLGLHQRFYERSEKAITLVLGEVKQGFIGLLGTSVGALHSAVAASLQDRISAVFIITGGAPLSEVIVNSDQEAMTKLAENRRKAFGFKSKTEYLAALAPMIKLEPMKLGEGFKNKKLGMIVALEDTTVPTEMQKNLMNYWKPQLVIEKHNGHFWAIINSWLHNADEILDFFETAFKHS